MCKNKIPEKDVQDVYFNVTKPSRFFRANNNKYLSKNVLINFNYLHFNTKLVVAVVRIYHNRLLFSHDFGESEESSLFYKTTNFIKQIYLTLILGYA